MKSDQKFMRSCSLDMAIAAYLSKSPDKQVKRMARKFRKKADPKSKATLDVILACPTPAKLVIVVFDEMTKYDPVPVEVPVEVPENNIVPMATPNSNPIDMSRNCVSGVVTRRNNDMKFIKNSDETRIHHRERITPELSAKLSNERLDRVIADAAVNEVNFSILPPNTIMDRWAESGRGKVLDIEVKLDTDGHSIFTIVKKNKK